MPTTSHFERQPVVEFGLFFSILLLVYGANILKFHLVSSYRMYPHSFLYIGVRPPHLLFFSIFFTIHIVETGAFELPSAVTIPEHLPVPLMTFELSYLLSIVTNWL